MIIKEFTEIIWIFFFYVKHHIYALSHNFVTSNLIYLNNSEALSAANLSQWFL